MVGQHESPGKIGIWIAVNGNPHIPEDGRFGSYVYAAWNIAAAQFFHGAVTVKHLCWQHNYFIEQDWIQKQAFRTKMVASVVYVGFA